MNLRAVPDLRSCKPQVSPVEIATARLTDGHHSSRINVHALSVGKFRYGGDYVFSEWERSAAQSPRVREASLMEICVVFVHLHTLEGLMSE